MTRFPFGPGSCAERPTRAVLCSSFETHGSSTGLILCVTYICGFRGGWYLRAAHLAWTARRRPGFTVTFCGGACADP
jgi:hypothetical protein